MAQSTSTTEGEETNRLINERSFWFQFFLKVVAVDQLASKRLSEDGPGHGGLLPMCNV